MQYHTVMSLICGSDYIRYLVSILKHPTVVYKIKITLYVLIFFYKKKKVASLLKHAIIFLSQSKWLIRGIFIIFLEFWWSQLFSVQVIFELHVLVISSALTWLHSSHWSYSTFFGWWNLMLNCVLRCAYNVDISLAFHCYLCKQKS